MDEHRLHGSDPEIEFSEILALVWRARWFVVATAAMFLAVGTLYVLLATPLYRAETTLVRKEGRSGAGALAQFGGLASLAGINMGGEQLTPVAVLRSRGLSRDFIEQQGLLPVLFSDKWDASTKGWRSGEVDKHPDIRDAVDKFASDVRSVVDDKKTGLVTVSITWSDPDAAASWANDLVRMVNDRMRQEALTDTERNIRFLRTEVAATNIPSLQQSVGRVLEAEMQKLMLARGGEEFAFRVVDKAESPKKPVSPRTGVILVGSLILGLLTSFVLIVLRRVLRGM